MKSGWVAVFGGVLVMVVVGALLMVGQRVEEVREVVTKEKVLEQGVWVFPEEQVRFDTRFPRARLTECEALGDGKFGLVVRPENLPVNNSPWFAFQVSCEVERKVTLRLRVQGGNLRYRPKVSVDGVTWVTLTEEAYQQDEAREECVLKLEVGPRALWVAAQELVSTQEMLDWAGALERLPFVQGTTFGRSVGGQRLCRLDIGDVEAERAVVIIGRQHPPETTGSLALMRFVEEIAGDSDLARSFRGQFHCVVMPLLNPDGVDAGNWRHNLGRVDLNRDWKDFAQPETRAVRDQIVALGKAKKLRLMLDFHSTFKDVFYTQSDEAVSSPAGFTRLWLEALETRLPMYEAKREASPVPTPTTSTYWGHHTFGIPAITYEIGDNTDRALLKTVAATAAQEMMRLMLEMKEAP
jgi:hypothetical protein